MMFTNKTGLPAAWTVGFERDGREMLIVVIKQTYMLPLSGELPISAPEQMPLVEADRFSGEPGLSAPSFETDYAHRKGACDVVLLGSAYAPEGEPIDDIPVGLRVGAMLKEFRVVGNRAWYKGRFGIAATQAQLFNVMPLSYDVAFGGTDRTYEAQGQVDTYLPNPVGRGYWRNLEQIDSQPLPNTEELNRIIDDPTGDFRPMAFSPIGRNWSPRLGFAGTYDQQWMENEAPFWPQDFDYRYFQSVPADQFIPYPQGGEQVTLRNLTLDGYREFQLPRQQQSITFIQHQGRDITLRANVDTLVLEPDKSRFTLTWRANLPLGKSPFDVRETIVGEMSRGWHRARLGGKQYYRDLTGLVRDRRGRGERG